MEVLSEKTAIADGDNCAVANTMSSKKAILFIWEAKVIAGSNSHKDELFGNRKILLSDACCGEFGGGKRENVQLFGQDFLRCPGNNVEVQRQMTVFLPLMSNSQNFIPNSHYLL